jgi:hypothetical protein
MFCAHSFASDAKSARPHRFGQRHGRLCDANILRTFTPQAGTRGSMYRTSLSIVSLVYLDSLNGVIELRISAYLGKNRPREVNLTI